MAILKQTEVVDYGDEEFEYSPYVISPPWSKYPYPTAGDTVILRGNTGRKRGRLGTGTLENEFINRIRAVAEVWHNVLTENERNIWLWWNTPSDGARPGMDKNFPNGWNLFAMVALAAMRPGCPTAAYEIASEDCRPDSFTFDQADEATQQLTFTADFDAAPFQIDHGFTFIHQVDPKHIDKRDADRRSYCVGYYQYPTPYVGPMSFSFTAVFPFIAGDRVQVLARLHSNVYGVTNLLLTCTAT